MPRFTLEFWAVKITYAQIDAESAESATEIAAAVAGDKSVAADVAHSILDQRENGDRYEETIRYRVTPVDQEPDGDWLSVFDNKPWHWTE